MSESTNIAWCDSTASPWTICTKVSPGCANCYAAELAKRYGWGEWGAGKPRHKFKGFAANCRKWNKQAEVAQQEWAAHMTLHGGHPHYDQPRRPRIFPSLCDWLDDEVPIECLAEFLQVIHECCNLDFLLLTKRLENLHRIAEVMAWMQDSGQDLGKDDDQSNLFQWCYWWIAKNKPPPNVWVGASCENQEYADKRIPELLNIPAKVRFLSCEPLLGEIEFGAVPGGLVSPIYQNRGRKIDWVIVGGESGKHARPMEIAWVESIADQCSAANVPLFVKQDSGPKPGMRGRIPDHLWKRKEFPRL